MDMPTDDHQAPLRRSVYLLLIMLGTGVMLGRILAVDSVDKLALQTYRTRKVQEKLDRKREGLKRKGLSGERLESALEKFAEEEGLWEWARLRRPFLSANDRSRWCTIRVLVEKDLQVEGHPYAIDKVQNEPGWDTIDMVKHDGHLYSSKPPLLPTLMAAAYWAIYHLTGMSLGTHPYAVARIMLIALNVIPLVICFLLLARLVERFGRTDWGRFFVMGAAVLGTFLTTFAVVINNHLPAAVCATVALYAAVRIWFEGEQRLRYFVLAGLFATLTAANELPGLAFLAALGAALLWRAPLRTLLGYLPAALLVTAAFFLTNWIAHGDLRPPYLHRSQSDPGDNWYVYEYERNGKVHQSYWQHPVGVDQGEPSPMRYAMHVLIGHHGIVSLTPIWLLSALGAILWLGPGSDRRLRQLAILIGAVTLVCLAFYLSRGLHHRNYGGVTSGLRWMFWFAPMWLLTMLPAADAMAARGWTRCVALVLLAVSVLSASYPVWNPWTNPWIMDYLYYLDWIG